MAGKRFAMAKYWKYDLFFVDKKTLRTRWRRGREGVPWQMPAGEDRCRMQGLR
ncbi:hypothetical protein B4114_1210 [Geobacillus stearothermophilus]|uniref:Uncharacterized protein n=1 Tax=Geobacillus stearothermophilus TaxID=1422 RepID=A0A150NF76_GEOSE|nr:hypothetical protein B4114_1210 [Geobacillus stearothermophilus]